VNALKYTLADGTVRMRWRTDDEGAYFSVVDTGIGIPRSTFRGSRNVFIASMRGARGAKAARVSDSPS